MSQWMDVCASQDLQPDSGICALVEGKQVAIFHLVKLDSVFAINNFDPIGKANVLSRGLVGDVNGQPMVSSPLYKQHYNLQTGQCMEDEAVTVEVYQVRISDGRVEVNVEQ